MLAATRWGSYIGVSPLFLTDLLIVGSLVDRLAGRTMYPHRESLRSGFVPGPPTIIMAFLVYTALRMLTSGSWTLTVTWLRDGAPYLYAVLGLVSADAVRRATPASLQATMRWIWVALIFHLGWVCGIGPLSCASAFAAAATLLAGGIFYGKPTSTRRFLG